MKRGFQSRMSGRKGKDGRMIVEGKTLERWIEHFTEMLNEDEDKEEDNKWNIIAKLDHALEQP